MPSVLTTPSVGLIPTMPCSPAGTRPEPAVSVPIAISASPVATATADPALDPPLMNSGLRLSGTAPYGDRVPTRPVANWSRLVLPTTTAPAARSAATASLEFCRDLGIGSAADPHGHDDRLGADYPQRAFHPHAPGVRRGERVA